MSVAPYGGHRGKRYRQEAIEGQAGRSSLLGLYRSHLIGELSRSLYESYEKRLPRLRLVLDPPQHPKSDSSRLQGCG